MLEETPRFYGISELDFQDFALEVWELSELTTVEVLNCAKSFRRQPTDYTPVEFFELFGTRKLHTVFKYHPNCRGIGKHLYEVGCCTMDAHDHDADYFLFIYTSIEDGEKLIKKYSLNEIR